MALRSIHAMKDLIKDMEEVCPQALLFNYTNPVNIVSEAITHITDIPIVSLCEGPIVSSEELADIMLASTLRKSRPSPSASTTPHGVYATCTTARI